MFTMHCKEVDFRTASRSTMCDNICFLIVECSHPLANHLNIHYGLYTFCSYLECGLIQYGTKTNHTTHFAIDVHGKPWWVNLYLKKLFPKRSSYLHPPVALLTFSSGLQRPQWLSTYTVLIFKGHH